MGEHNGYYVKKKKIDKLVKLGLKYKSIGKKVKDNTRF